MGLIWARPGPLRALDSELISRSSPLDLDACPDPPRRIIISARVTLAYLTAFSPQVPEKRYNLNYKRVNPNLILTLNL